MVTMKKIAELCNVSRGTVDRVLNGRGKVKPESGRQGALGAKALAARFGYPAERGQSVL